MGFSTSKAAKGVAGYAADRAKEKAQQELDLEQILARGNVDERLLDKRLASKSALQNQSEQAAIDLQKQRDLAQDKRDADKNRVSEKYYDTRLEDQRRAREEREFRRKEKKAEKEQEKRDKKIQNRNIRAATKARIAIESRIKKGEISSDPDVVYSEIKKYIMKNTAIDPKTGEYREGWDEGRVDDAVYGIAAIGKAGREKGKKVGNVTDKLKLAAVHVDMKPIKEFEDGTTRPINPRDVRQALEEGKISREQHDQYMAFLEAEYPDIYDVFATSAKPADPQFLKGDDVFNKTVKHMLTGKNPKATPQVDVAPYRKEFQYGN